MLIVCPECSLQVSDKAFVCPHCGFPMKKDAQIYRKKEKASTTAKWLWPDLRDKKSKSSKTIPSPHYCRERFHRASDLQTAATAKLF